MRVALCSDEKYPVHDTIRRLLEERGHEVVPFGAVRTGSDAPWADAAEEAALAVASGACDEGVFLCWTGTGISMAANKVPGIRAAVCHDTYSAHQGVEHDDMNVLVLGGRIVGPALALELVRAFVAARFSGEERHVRRLGKVKALETRYR